MNKSKAIEGSLLDQRLFVNETVHSLGKIVANVSWKLLSQIINRE